jgi:ribosomal protein L16 Arg81 hydroxylase
MLAAEVGAFVGARGPVTVNSFLSPDGHGFPWHLDNPHVFALQIEGTKRWRLGRRQVVAAPFLTEAEGPRAEATLALLRQLGMPIEPPSDDDSDEITLVAGDVLYMPPGVWHRASAVGGSCHISLLVRPMVFGRLLRAVVAALGIRSEMWRTDLQRMTPETRDAFLTERLAEARAELAAITPAHLVHTLDLLASSPLARLTLLERVRDTL